MKLGKPLPYFTFDFVLYHVFSLRKDRLFYPPFVFHRVISSAIKSATPTFVECCQYYNVFKSASCCFKQIIFKKRNSKAMPR